MTLPFDILMNYFWKNLSFFQKYDEDGYMVENDSFEDEEYLSEDEDEYIVDDDSFEDDGFFE